MAIDERAILKTELRWAMVVAAIVAVILGDDSVWVAPVIAP